MTTTVVKIDRDVDFYVMWESITESPTMWGTRSALCRPSMVEAGRFGRADAHGSSSLWGWGWWDDDTFIYEQRGILRRAKMREAVARLEDDREACICDLLEKFWDAEAVRCDHA